MKRFADFARSSCNLEGDKFPIGDLFGETIVVLNYRILQSKYKPERECVQIQFERDGKKHVCFSTSAVLINQLQTYANELPFEATLQRHGNYFTFT